MQVRAFARLPPERQRELLRQSGAAERLARLGRTERASLAGPFWEEQARTLKPYFHAVGIRRFLDKSGVPSRITNLEVPKMQ